MLELPHVMAGIAIVSKIPNPIIALPLALLSHIVLDYIPHWNPSLYKETIQNGKPSRESSTILVVDVILCLIVGFSIAFRALPNIGAALIILAASFASVIMDVVEGFYFYFGVKNKLLVKLIEFQHQHQSRASLVPGIITQLAVIVISSFFIFNF